MNATQWFLFVLLPAFVAVTGVAFAEVLRWQNIKRKTPPEQPAQSADESLKLEHDLPQRLAQATAQLESLIRQANQSGRLSRT